MSSISLYPDPVLSANIYGSGHVDRILNRTLRPFLLVARERYPDSGVYVWTMRYDRGGEHLKVRLHGPESEREVLGEMLSETVERFFADLDEDQEPPPEANGGFSSPPIDAEDEAGPHADRSWCWTTYRRSHVALGGEPFLLDDGYAARFTRCQGAACEVALEALVPDVDGVVPHRVRHNTLTKLLLGGLAALGFDELERRDYLYFHRDWLIRFPLLKSDSTSAKAREITDHFEQRWSKMAAALEPLGRLARAEWEEADVDADPWRSTLADLWSYTAPLCEAPAYHIDPFAAAPIFSPIFKVLHGAANQLGLGMLEEALVYHLLLRAAAPTAPVRLDVSFEPAESAA